MTSSSANAITLDTATQTDLAIRCQGVDVRVNKCIVVRHSEVLRRFVVENPRRRVLHIDMEEVTPEVVRLLFKAMYENKWDKAEMDKHAKWLLRLAINVVDGDHTLIIYVQHSLMAQTIHLRASPTDTIQQLKSHIEDKTGIPTDVQSITLDDVALEDERTLADYDIKHCSYALELEYTLDGK